MTGTLPGADVRGFYRALGIELPEWAKREAPVPCFADPGAHARGDRDPSCSVNLESGAWHCWGCGAAGGAYDAALACGRHPREAIDLMVVHGLTARRVGGAVLDGRSAPARQARQDAGRSPAGRVRAELDADEQQLDEARERLAGLVWPPRVLRPEHVRLWSRATLLETIWRYRPVRGECRGRSSRVSVGGLSSRAAGPRAAAHNHIGGASRGED